MQSVLNVGAKLGHLLLCRRHVRPKRKIMLLEMMDGRAAQKPTVTPQMLDEIWKCSAKHQSVMVDLLRYSLLQIVANAREIIACSWK